MPAQKVPEMPDPVMLSKIGGHMLHVLESNLTRYVVTAGVATIILWVFARWLEIRRIQKRRATRRDIAREILSSVRTVGVYALVTLITFALREIGIVKLKLEEFTALQLVVQSLVIIVAHDAYFYWMHRALHHRRLFRATHLHHHKSRTPTAWAAYSFSSWEAVTEILFLPIFLLITSLLGFAWVGAALLVFVWHMIIRNVIGHCGIEIYPRGWVDNRFTGWWNTVTHHDLHHSAGTYNFGLYFTWWDRWMGTEHPRYREEFRRVTERGRDKAAEAVPA